MFCEEIKKFSEYLNQYQLAESTFKLYIVVVNSFLSKKKELTQETLNKFIKKRPRLYIKRALQYYLKYKKLDKEIELIKVRVPARRPRAEPTREQLKSIIDKIQDQEVKLFFELLYNTGARASEALNIKVKDLDFIASTLTLKVKGGYYRQVKLTVELANELKIYTVEELGKLGNEKVFFSNCNSSKVAYIILRRRIKTLSNLSDSEKDLIKKTHSFRRALINHLFILTSNIRLVQKFIGHKSIDTTSTYLSEKTDKELVEEANKLLRLYHG